MGGLDALFMIPYPDAMTAGSAKRPHVVHRRSASANVELELLGSLSFRYEARTH